MKFNKYITALIFFLVFTGLATESSAVDSVLEEIVVSAQKRDQNLQDVSISVTSFTSDQMRSLGITESFDLVAQTPGLEVTGAGGGALSSFSIRGVTQNDFSSSQEGPVAVYIDESYVSQYAVTRFALFDLERVEVLRGPQSTLFGRNATGGLVHYLTVRPSQDSDGYAELMVGEKGRLHLEAAVGGGISDTVSGRLSVVVNDSDGLIENDIGPDVMADGDHAVRAQLLIEPSDGSTILLKAQFANEDSRKGAYSHRVATAGVFDTDPTVTDWWGYKDADGSPYTGSYDFDAYNKADVSNLSVRIERDRGDSTFISLTDYQDIDHSYGEDADVSPTSIYHYESFDKAKQISQEFRLNWENDNSRSVIGLFYLDIDGAYDTSQHGDAYFGVGYQYKLNVELDTKTIALFGQREIDLNDTTTLIFGARLNKDEKDFSFADVDSGLYYTGSFSDTDTAAKVKLEIRPNDDLLWYVGVDRGIRSGGFNQPLAPPEDFATFPYGGEVLLAYEAGFKRDLNESTRLNMSIFLYDHKDYQAFTFDAFVPLIFNAGADTTGMEIELVSNPFEGLDILLGATWIDAEVTDLDTNIFPTGKAAAVFAPKFTFNALIRYAWETSSGGTLAWQLDANWKDDHTFNLIYSPVIEEDAYGIANFQLSYTNQDGSWYGSVFVKNITDQEYRTYSFDTTAYFNSTEDVAGYERWVGVSVIRKF